MTQMRFGIQTSINGVTWAELSDMWRFLDTETQFYSAWTFDHFVPPGAGQDLSGPCFEGWSSLAARIVKSRISMRKTAPLAIR